MSINFYLSTYKISLEYIVKVLFGKVVVELETEIRFYDQKTFKRIRF